MTSARKEHDDLVASITEPLGKHISDRILFLSLPALPEEIRHALQEKKQQKNKKLVITRNGDFFINMAFGRPFRLPLPSFAHTSLNSVPGLF